MRRATMGSARQFAPLSIFAPVCFHIFSGPHRPRAIQNRMWWYCSFYLQAGEQESKQKQERGEQERTGDRRRAQAQAQAQETEKEGSDAFWKLVDSGRRRASKRGFSDLFPGRLTIGLI